jgi:hypothetical protein
MLSRAAAVLVIIDIQGNLAQAMFDKDNLFANNIKLIKGFKALGLPIIITEQTPEKLGETYDSIDAELAGIKPNAKESFSCWPNAQFREHLESLSRRHVVLTGIENPRLRLSDRAGTARQRLQRASGSRCRILANAGKPPDRNQRHEKRGRANRQHGDGFIRTPAHRRRFESQRYFQDCKIIFIIASDFSRKRL